MICGIYKIECIINHKVYIGQSVHIEKRWKGKKQSEESNLKRSLALKQKRNEQGHYC